MCDTRDPDDAYEELRATAFIHFENILSERDLRISDHRDRDTDRALWREAMDRANRGAPLRPRILR